MPGYVDIDAVPEEIEAIKAIKNLDIATIKEQVNFAYSLLLQDANELETAEQELMMLRRISLEVPTSDEYFQPFMELLEREKTEYYLQSKVVEGYQRIARKIDHIYRIKLREEVTSPRAIENNGASSSGLTHQVSMDKTQAVLKETQEGLEAAAKSVLGTFHKLKLGKRSRVRKPKDSAIFMDVVVLPAANALGERGRNLLLKAFERI